ncbi:TPA: hypothetical protein ACH3X2_011391 [Trebouxia sp. C0005]
MCSCAFSSLLWLLHNSRRRAQERQSSVKLGPELLGLTCHAQKVGANGDVMHFIAGCLLEEFEKACMDLAELVEEYEPELMRLPGNAPSSPVETSRTTTA